MNFVCILFAVVPLRNCEAQKTLCSPPSSFTVFRGKQQEGNLDSFAASDDSYATFTPSPVNGPSVAPVWLVFEAVAPATTQFNLESYANTPGLFYTFEAWNWNRNRWDFIDSQAESVFDEVSNPACLDPSNHVDDSGRVRGRVSWRAQGPLLVYPWNVSVDAFNFCNTGSAVTVTIKTAERRFIGDVNRFEREKYISHHNTLTGFNQAQRDYLWHHLNIFPTRTIGELIGLSVQIEPEECLFNSDSLAAAVENTSNGLLSSPRYEPFSLTDKLGQPIFPNAKIVRSGKANNQWPELLRKNSAGVVQQHGPLNFPAYSQMMSTFYGQADLKLPIERQYLELANELWVNGFSEQEAIDLHVNVANALHEDFPDLNVGGPTQAWPRYNRNNFAVWGRAERFVQQAGNAIDFYSLHLYDSTNRVSDGNGGVIEVESPTDPLRTMAVLDLLEGTTLDELGEVKPMIISEYGMLNNGETEDESIFPEALQQWYVMRSVKDKLIALMDRPDRIDVATPFINVTTSWRFNGVDPAEWPAIGNEVLFKGVGANHYETHNTKLYELLRDLKGSYISADSASPNIQVQAFRDANVVHVLLNNMSNEELTVNLKAMLQTNATVETATIKRLSLVDGTPTFIDDVDISNQWQFLPLLGEESAALSLSLAATEGYDFAKRQRTFYSNERIVEVLATGATLTINADTCHAISANLRVGLSMASTIDQERDGILPAFSVSLNNGTWGANVPSEKVGREDLGMTVRQFEIPISALIDGTNSIHVDFGSAGGHVTSAVLEISHSIGDFNENGSLDSEDRNRLLNEIGNEANSSNDHFDLNEDGSIDLNDLKFWDDLQNE